MRARLSLALALGALGACAPGEPGSGPELWIELEPLRAEVELGQAFELTLVRGHRRELVPEPFDEADLAPLQLELQGAEPRSRGAMSVETRRYRARVFELGALTLGPLELRAPDPRGGPELRAQSAPLELRVISSLGLAEGSDPGPPELPGDLLSRGRSRPWPALLAASAALLGILGWAALRARARARAAALRAGAPTRAEQARARARARLAALQGAAPASRAEDEALHVELAALLREYLEQVFDLPAARRSSVEICADARLDGARRATLAEILHACDAVKFSPRGSTPAGRAHSRAQAERFLLAPAGIAGELERSAAP